MTKTTNMDAHHGRVGEGPDLLCEGRKPKLRPERWGDGLILEKEGRKTAMCFASRGKRVGKREVRGEVRPNQAQFRVQFQATAIFFFFFNYNLKREVSNREMTRYLKTSDSWDDIREWTPELKEKRWVHSFEVLMKCARFPVRAHINPTAMW